MYPLPLVLPRNEFFWISGADGVLRLREAVREFWREPEAVFWVFITMSSIGLPGLNGFVGEVLVLNDNFCVRINEIVAGAKEEGM